MQLRNPDLTFKLIVTKPSVTLNGLPEVRPSPRLAALAPPNLLPGFTSHPEPSKTR